MKIAVINFSGNVGKSTVARHLVVPRLRNAQLIAIESINAHGSQDEAIRGKQFGQLQEALALMEDAVVDVGASNVEDFINLMTQYQGSHEDFDYFVVPTVSKAKQQRDTVSTIEALADIGIPPKKIRLVFNMVEMDEQVEQVVGCLFDYYASAKRFTLKSDATIHVNDIYGKLNGAQKSISEVLADPTDFKEQIKAAKEDQEKLKFAQMLSVKRLAVGVTAELDSVFKTLMK
ncbi:hypothetical protein GALL_481250 [mine drainage metagenome]|uniref:StbB n=1 Tax=mine drainage metagenome TaxID=410659 RepID=A0A1J5PHK4_9ZZZZ